MVVAVDAPTLPEEIMHLLEDLRRGGRTVKLELDIKDGRILGWELKERGRVQPPKYPMG